MNLSRIKDPTIAIPLAIGGSVLLMKLHIFRYLKRSVLPVGLAAIIYRALYATHSQTLLEILVSYIRQIQNPNIFHLSHDIIGSLILLTVINGLHAATSVNYATLKKSILDFAYQIAKLSPQVQSKLTEEREKFEATLDHDMKKKSRSFGQSLSRLPGKGIAPEAILELLSSAISLENKNWMGGKVSGSVYHGGQAHQALLNQAFSMYSLANPLHPDIWPSGMKFESEIIAMTASLMTSRPLDQTELCGNTSSGGTESIILAAKAHRDYYRSKHGITQPEIVACVSAHAAIEKACELLSIKLIQVPMDPQTFKCDVRAVEWAISPNTVMIYSSAPQFPQGVIDPISQLSAIAVRYGVGLHVDCCLGGFVLPFARKLGYDIPGMPSLPPSLPPSLLTCPSDFDFDLPGVTSMSVDTHKYGCCLKGASVVLYRTKELRHAQYFCYSDWTGGIYTTPTIAGSRSTGLIAQAWASLVSIGEEGFLENTRNIIETTRSIGRAVALIPELEVIGGVEAMIVCFRSALTEVNIYNVGDYLAKKGWSLNTLQHPSSIHLCVTLQHVGAEERFIQDLKDAVKQAKSTDGMVGNAAIYGLASSLPAGPVDEMLRLFNDVVTKI
jgi:sphinganine-1-phosphate aldolase